MRGSDNRKWHGAMILIRYIHPLLQAHMRVGSLFATKRCMLSHVHFEIIIRGNTSSNDASGFRNIRPKWNSMGISL